ncbi:hypothetical protein ASF62_02085 [Leifsonia sp. Leaf325]|nr:hypothetical protein [Leifsonia sp. Leaf325]KQQ95350.1 hypothetical protein ASF62_02085 [Leifsonia sp. Leaf325]
MSGLQIYFGEELPDLTWSRSLTDTDVVLQPYHRLVSDGGFADAFPNSRRFVYVNPTTVDPWILEGLAVAPPLLGLDERWALPRLDLDTEAGFAYAVSSAVAAGSGGRPELHGLFVDDLDRLMPDQLDVAMRYLAAVTEDLGWEPRWFVNRGFDSWPMIENLDAVLLEDIVPEFARGLTVAHIRWIRDVVLPNMHGAHDRGVRIHSLGYRDEQGAMDLAPDLALEQDLDALLDSITVAPSRQLNDWRNN